MGRRRQAREYALKMLFQIDQGGLPPQEVMDYFLGENQASEEVLEYARALTSGVTREMGEIDRLISRQAQNWRLARIAAVDRNILRVAVFELLHCPDVPASAVINEAIEIAKKYSTEESGRFVNGILDKIPRPNNLQPRG